MAQKQYLTDDEATHLDQLVRNWADHKRVLDRLIFLDRPYNIARDLEKTLPSVAGATLDEIRQYETMRRQLLDILRRFGSTISFPMTTTYMLNLDSLRLIHGELKITLVTLSDTIDALTEILSYEKMDQLGLRELRRKIWTVIEASEDVIIYISKIQNIPTVGKGINMAVVASVGSLIKNCNGL